MPFSLPTSKLILYPFLLVLLFFSTNVTSQEDRDSLEYYLKKLSNSTNTAQDSTLLILKKAKHFATTRELISVLRQEAVFYRKHGNSQAAFEVYSEALKLTMDNNYIVLQGLVQFDISNYYYYMNNLEISFKSILKAKLLLEQATDEEISKYNRTSLNDHDYTRYELLEPIMFNIGVVALDRGNLDEAEVHFKDAVVFYGKKGNKQGQIDAYINLATICFEKKRYQHAIEAFKKIVDDYELTPVDLSLVYYNFAIIYNESNNIDLAKSYIDKAIEITERLDDEIQLIDLYFFKANMEQKLGNYSLSSKLLLYSLKGSIELKDFYFQEKVCRLLAESETSLGHYKQANNWYLKMLSARDSLGQDDIEDLYKRVDLEHRLKVQEVNTEQQYALLESEKARTRFLISAIIFGFLLFISLIYVWLVSKKNSFKREELAKQKIAIKEVQLENKRLLEEEEIKRIHEDLKAKKRELMLSLLATKKRKNKLIKIIKEFEKIEDNSIIRKTDLQYLKEFIIIQSDELEKNENIQQQIINTHEGFFTKLLDDYPSLSKTELKVLAYMRVGLETKEIADVQYVSVDAIKKTRHRIRKKLDIEAKQSLEKFILKY